MSKLDGLDPLLVGAIGRVLDAMQKNGTPMRITSGVRTAAEQALLYGKGRNGRPGPIVTNCDGLHTKSQHQLGRAVDCCFVGSDPFGESQPWGKYGDECRRQGLIWGGDWRGKLVDRPHAELPKADPNMRVA